MSNHEDAGRACGIPFRREKVNLRGGYGSKILASDRLR
jgi:hypothetical protein